MTAESGFREAIHLAGHARSARLRSAARRVTAGPLRRRVDPAVRRRQLLFEHVLSELQMRPNQAQDPKPPEVRALVSEILDARREDRLLHGLSAGERSALIEAVVSEVCGLGPLDPLLADPSISDILVNGADDVWIDRFGRLERTTVHFDDNAHLTRMISRMVAAHGRHLEESTPYVDARLPDGSRVHAMIEPISTRGPVVAIRRMRRSALSLSDLVAGGTLTRELGGFLEEAVRAGCNVLIAGGAATGKTTLLNILAGAIPHTERVVTIEETTELILDHPHVLPLEARPANMEGRGAVPLGVLIRNALRMRADRIIVGEVRGREVFDMLQAMNLGHSGSLSTVHANHPADALRRLRMLMAMGQTELTDQAASDLIAHSFHLIVQLRRDTDGARRVEEVCEIIATGQQAETHALFSIPAGGRGVAQPTARAAAYRERLRTSGVRQVRDEGRVA